MNERCRAVWRAGVLSPPGGPPPVLDGTRCKLAPHDESVPHQFPRWLEKDPKLESLETEFGKVWDAVNGQAGTEVLQKGETLGENIVRFIDKQARRLVFVERTLREHLWLNHGHDGLYGDDGEMQCAACIPFGVSDYKRQTVEELLEGQRNLSLFRLLPVPPP